MAGEPISFVKSCKSFFESEPHGRKVEIAELKSLSLSDRQELREELIAQGFNVTAFESPPPVG